MYAVTYTNIHFLTFGYFLTQQELDETVSILGEIRHAVPVSSEPTKTKPATEKQPGVAEPSDILISALQTLNFLVQVHVHETTCCDMYMYACVCSLVLWICLYSLASVHLCSPMLVHLYHLYLCQPVFICVC